MVVGLIYTEYVCLSSNCSLKIATECTEHLPSLIGKNRLRRLPSVVPAVDIFDSLGFEFLA